MHDVRPDGLEERIRAGDSILHGLFRLCFRCIAVHLRRIENGIATREQKPRAAGRRFAAIVPRLLRIIGELPEHNGRGLLAFAHLRPTILPLLVGAPLAGRVPFGFSSGP